MFCFCYSKTGFFRDLEQCVLHILLLKRAVLVKTAPILSKIG